MKASRAAAFEIGLFVSGALLWGASSLYDYKTSSATAATTGANSTTAASPEAMQPYTESVPGTNVKFEMVPIPSGTFNMGSPATEANRSADEGPQHQVKIHPFWMGRGEVTWDEYDRFAFTLGVSRQGTTNPGQKSEADKLADAITRPTPPYADPTFGFGHDGYPAISMTHHAAMEYTRWLSAKTGKTYRLPTEAEWEYACRAGTTTAYSFGVDPKNVSDYAWLNKNSEARSHPVGKKKPNPWGLYDMNGNVAEWVLDHYDRDYYKSFPPLIPADSPVLMPDDKEYPYVVRGGSWADDEASLRCAARRASNEDWSKQDPQLPQSIWWHTDATFVGFRIVRPLDEQDNLKGLKSRVNKLD